MVSLNDAKAYAAAERDFVMRTPFAHYAMHGSAAPGAAFAVSQKGGRQHGFGNSASQIELPPGSYRIAVHESIWSEGTADPQTVVVDVYDVGAAAVVASFSAERPSADPDDPVLISEPMLYTEADAAIVGPIEFRNGAGATQRAALYASLWPLPEAWPRPNPEARYYRNWHIRRPAGESYCLAGAFEFEVNPQTGDQVRRAIRRTDSTSQVPWGPNGPTPGDYQVQLSGALTNLSSSPATLSIGLYSDDNLLHTESVEAAGLDTVEISLDETIALSGRFDVRSGSADQRVDLLLKVWRLP